MSLEDKKQCPKCNGTGMDKAKSIKHEEAHHELVGFYCDCWYGWLLQQRDRDDSEAEEISLLEVEDPWGMQPDGKYRRKITAFFELIGVKFRGNREVPFWSQPILKEIDQGLVVIIKTSNGEILLQAKVEPGNPEEKSHMLLAASIQASASNLDQEHGGKKPALSEYLHSHPINIIEIPQDGGRFLEKVNKYGIINVESKDDVPDLEENMRWFTEEEIEEAFWQKELNTHLVQVLYADSKLSK